MIFAVIKTGGKQYLVKENDEIVAEKLDLKKGQKLELEMLAEFDNEGDVVELGYPLLKKTVKAEVVDHMKGDKLRISRFKAKVRYRKVKGFRPQLTKLKILKV